MSTVLMSLRPYVPTSLRPYVLASLRPYVLPSFRPSVPTGRSAPGERWHEWFRSQQRPAPWKALAGSAAGLPQACGCPAWGVWDAGGPRGMTAVLGL